MAAGQALRTEAISAPDSRPSSGLTAILSDVCPTARKASEVDHTVRQAVVAASSGNERPARSSEVGLALIASHFSKSPLPR